ncbi:leucine-rich repeat domain-containing protein [Prevotella sp.]
MKQFYILMIALFIGLSANAEKTGKCGDNLNWRLTDDGVLTITGTGQMDNYDDNLSASPWYYNKDIKQVIIADGATTIGEYAFIFCTQLTSVKLPNSVTTIGNEAFNQCKALTSINTPNSLTTIGNKAFRDCKALTSINLPNSVTTIGDEAFDGCTALTSINIPDGVTKIGYRTFMSCIYNHRTTKTNQKYPSVNL